MSSLGEFEHVFPSGVRVTMLAKTTSGRRMTLAVGPGGFIISFPMGTKGKSISAFIDSLEHFVLRHMARSVDRADFGLTSTVWGKMSGGGGVAISLFGVEMTLRLRETTESVGFSFEDEDLVVSVPDGTHPRNALLDCLSKITVDSARLYMERNSSAMGLPMPSAIVTGKFSSKWGHCTSRGTIALDWRSPFLDVDLFEHLVAHEQCHLVHMNHSRAFWKILGSMRENCKRESDALRIAMMDVPVF